jgi:hypothetical protein
MNTDELNDDLREEYDLQQLRVRKVGHARNNVLRVNTKRVAIMKKRNVYGERCLRIKREDAI